MSKRSRLIGMGMKPREGTVASEPASGGILSESAVQADEPEVASEEAVVAEPEGGDLETSSLQNLDSQPEEVVVEAEMEAVVAQIDVVELPPAVPQEAADSLAALMAKSEEVSGAEPQFTDEAIPVGNSQT